MAHLSNFFRTSGPIHSAGGWIVSKHSGQTVNSPKKLSRNAWICSSILKAGAGALLLVSTLLFEPGSTRTYPELRLSGELSLVSQFDGSPESDSLRPDNAG